MPLPLALDEDAAARATRSLRRRDPRLGAVIRELGPCELRRRGDPYRALVRSVLFQQVAGSAARAIEARLKGHYGGRIPRAERLAEAHDATLRSLGLSRQKAAAVVAVARAFDAGEVSARRLARLSDEAVLEKVTRIRGIGPWSAHMMLMSSLGRPDVLPVGDYGIRKGAKLLYGLAELPDARALEALAAPWRPWRSIASWYLWRVAGGDVVLS